MSAFAIITAQHAKGLDFHRSGPVRGDVPAGGRPNTKPEQDALDHIRANPDVDARHIASAINIDPELLYTMLQRLKRGEQIYSTGRVGNSNRWRAY